MKLRLKRVIAHIDPRGGGAAHRRTWDDRGPRRPVRSRARPGPARDGEFYHGDEWHEDGERHPPLFSEHSAARADAAARRAAFQDQVGAVSLDAATRVPSNVVNDDVSLGQLGVWIGMRRPA